MKKLISIVILACLFIMHAASAQTPWRKELRGYISKLAKPDGGYGWEDQYDSHLSPTFAVTGILYHIGELPKDKNRLAEFIRTHHPQTGPNKEAGGSGSQMRNLIYEQIQAIKWLEGDVSSFKPEVSAWKSQKGVLANYEGHNFAGLFQESMSPISSALLGISMQNPEGFRAYLESCRRPNGSFNNAPASFGGDGNMLNTWWALLAWESMGMPQKMSSETITWIRSCQLPNGGFTHQPKPAIGVNDDISYTWAAIRALALLGSRPADTKAAVEYILSLRNSDGGFGSRKGTHSTPMASFYAIEALKTLGSLSALDKAPAGNQIREAKPDFEGYKVFSVQFQAHGSGSPQEAVMIADSLNIHLWGVKYPLEGWLEEAQRIADARRVPVKFFISNEPHDNEVKVEGMGSFNHVLDYIAPAGADVHFADSATVAEMKLTTIPELQAVNGGLMLQVSNNEPLARLLLDESMKNPWYLAISTVHFGQNFMFWLPYIGEYRYRFPLVTLQDAHGPESWWWLSEYSNHRTLFIGKEGSYEEMIRALKNNWVAGLRHDALTGYKSRMLGGTAAAREFIEKQKDKWRWWGPDNEVLSLPKAAISIIKPEDKYEAGRPESGIAVRIRVKWDNNRNTLRSSASDLVKLLINGKEVKAELVNVKGRGSATLDSYYIYRSTELKAGSHEVRAYVKDLASGLTEELRKTFTL